MNLQQALDFLLDNGYLAIVKRKVVVTNKMTREISQIPLKELEGKQQEMAIAPNKDIWDKFMKDADVPHKVIATDGKAYTVKQFSPQILQKLISIIQQVKDYHILTESTKLYYRSNAYKLTFKNYLEREVWKNEYEKYEEALKSPSQLNRLLSAGSGKNRFED